MNWADLNLMPALPEMFLLGALSVILILDLFISDAKRGITFGLEKPGTPRTSRPGSTPSR